MIKSRLFNEETEGNTNYGQTRRAAPTRVEWTLKAPAGNLLLLPTQSIVSRGWWQ